MSDYYISIREWTRYIDGLPTHVVELGHVYTDIHAIYAVSKKEIDSDKDVRIYVYGWHESDMPRYIGVLMQYMPEFGALNYGRCPEMSHFDALLMGFAKIAEMRLSALAE